MARIIPDDLRQIVACLNPVLGTIDYLLKYNFEKNDHVSKEDIQAIKHIIERLDKVRTELLSKVPQNLVHQKLETVYQKGWTELDKGIDDLLIVVDRIKQTLPPSEIEEIESSVHIIKAYRGK